MTAPSSAPRTARERARAELTAEIKDRAMAQLMRDGGAAISLRAIAREMGMSSSALFRYFPSRDAVLTALIVDMYDAVGEAAEQADAAARRAGGGVLDRWVAVCHGVRDWAVATPHGYALIFGSPIPGYAAPQDTIPPAERVPMILVGLLADLVTSGAYDPADADPLPDDAHRALDPVARLVPDTVPRDLLARGIMAWTYLLGAVSAELFGHRHNVVEDKRAFYDHEVRRLATALGIAG
jgi:AcrR family transcriptional regulator